MRGRLSKSMLLLGIGLVLMLMGSSSRWQYLAPGPLCKSHAQILRGLSAEQRCATCHAAAESEPISWVAYALGGPQIGPTQSERCMACHQASIAPTRSTLPHNLTQAQLAALHKTASKGRDEIACSVCHQEHHGADHPLAAMDDNRCQACHQQQFASFAQDHPPLGIWPYERRTPISFNHASHAGRHFADKGESFTCAMCHQSDTTGNVQRTLPYEQSCAKCHDGPLRTSLVVGVPLLTLPMVDIEALEAAGEQVGAWPESLTGDFDGPLPAPMKLLLARDPDWQAIVAVLGADFELGDVDPDDPAQLRAAAQVVRAIKRQWWRLQRGDANLRSIGLHPDLLREAQEAWLPELATEMASSGELPPSPAPPTGPAAFGSVHVTRDDTTMSLVYHAAGHSDPVLRAMLELAVAEADTASHQIALNELAGPTSPGLCATCHTIEPSSLPLLATHASSPRESPLTIRWRAADRSLDPRPFTKFSHRPHLTQVALRDCTSCHAIELGAATASSTGTNPHAFVSDFQPMSHQQCATCHQPQGANDRCTTCHNYHVGDLPAGL